MHDIYIIFLILPFDTKPRTIQIEITNKNLNHHLKFIETSMRMRFYLDWVCLAFTRDYHMFTHCVATELCHMACLTYENLINFSHI